MTLRVAALLFFAAVSCAAAAAAESRSPIAKVVSMMNDMMAKGKQEKQDEKVRFAAFEQFCKSTSAEKKGAIEKGKVTNEQLNADIMESEATAARLAKEIAKLDENVGGWDSDKEKAIDVRKKSKAAFEAAHAETVDCIASTEMALAKLNENPADVGQAALLQIAQDTETPARTKQAYLSFLQVDPATALMQDAEEFRAPEAAAFESSSGGVIEMVESMQEKFEDEKTELEKREMNMQNSHNLMVADLTGQTKQAKMERGMKVSAKAESEQDRAQAKGDLVDVKKALEEDSKFLADLTAECELKITDFHKRQHMRGEEIKAIQKAIEIMSSPDVMGGSAAAASFIQISSKKTTMAQLRSSSRAGGLSKAMVFLAQQAKRSRSSALSLIAEKMSTMSSTDADIFAKVKGMIKNMINKLMEEANAEATQKGFCDTEMGTNKMTRDSLTEEIGSLQSKIEQLTADINLATQQIASIQESVNTIDAQVAKATEERNTEKGKNQQTIEDSTIAQEATQKALQVLKEFQEKAANQPDLPKSDGPISWDPRALAIMSNGGSFVQQKARVPGAPEMASGEYKGMEGGGVTGLLEIIESDFASVSAETRTAELESQKAFEGFMNDANQDKAVKGTEIKHKQGVSVDKSSDLQEAKKTLKGAQRENFAANDYYEKLKPDCVDEGESYEDKVAARKQEIESLQEALKIFSGDAIA